MSGFKRIGYTITPALAKFTPSLLHDPSAITWLLRDDFTDTRAAGSVDGTPATPGPGTRSVLDTGNHLFVGGGLLDTDGTCVSTSDPSNSYDDIIARTAGRFVVMKCNTSAVNYGPMIYLTDVINSYGSEKNGYYFRNSLGIYKFDAGGLFAVGLSTASTFYYGIIVLRSAGAYLLIKGGSQYSNWTLLWYSSGTNNATLYLTASFTLTSSTDKEVDFLRIPDETWLPTPLAYDTFTAANGTSLDAHNSDTSGPDSQTTPSESWTEESGDWDIQSNRANPDGAGIATVDVSKADVLVDCTVNGGAAGQPAICLRIADTANYWYLQADRANNQFELHEYNATVDTVRASAAVTFNDSTDYDLRGICDGQTINGFANGANKISYGSAALNENETEHGLYSDNTACEFDDFLVFDRGGGAYSDLDTYIA